MFLEYDGKFVILLRHSHKPNGDTWGLPAGKVENGEDDKTALKRELFEETGYKAVNNELEHLGDYIFGKHGSKYTFTTYRVRLSEPQSIVIEESAHAKHKWATPVECYALNDLIPHFHELLNLVGFVETNK